MRNRLSDRLMVRLVTGGPTYQLAEMDERIGGMFNTLGAFPRTADGALKAIAYSYDVVAAVLPDAPRSEIDALTALQLYTLLDELRAYLLGRN